MKVLLIALIGLLSTTFAKKSFFGGQKKLLKENLEKIQNKNSGNYTVHWFEQQIDHMAFNKNATFKQKYLIQDKYYKEGGPIFFYCGNEGPVEMFYENTGFLNNVLGEKFNALVVYMEHRYYGDSMPFGSEKTSFEKKNLVYLTSLQALTDYQIFLDSLKVKMGDPDRPIIVTGGSYGGMLASWFRMKFPNTVDGALAASAPIAYFKNREGINFSSFYEIATNDFNHGTAATSIKQGFEQLVQIRDKGKDTDLDLLNSVFNLCDPITKNIQVQQLIDWNDDAYSYMAMTNYPYETDFLQKLPAWPANYSCQFFDGVTQNSDNFDIFTAMRKASEVYYNFEGKQTCNQIFSNGTFENDMSGWDVQACEELVMPMDSLGTNDMFPPSKFDTTTNDIYCHELYGVYPQYDWALDFYGGRTNSEFDAYSNIFFSNGMIDPWAGGGIFYSNEANDVGHILMPESAHHLDLRQPNPADPIYVQQGRELEIQYIQKWIDKKKNQAAQNEEKMFREYLEQ